MISSIQIHGYRGFEQFQMEDLERVNLVVGTNNSGKTSVLEALYLLTSRGAPFALWQVLWRRGERLPERGPNAPEMDVCHLFTGHEVHMGSKFTLTAKNQSPEKHVTFAIGEIGDEQSPKTTTVREGVPVASRLGLHIKGTPTPPVSVIPLSRYGGVSAESLESPRRVRGRPLDDEIPSQFITTESLSGTELVGLWDKVALTSNEERVLRALQFLEPGIERIAAQAATQTYYGSQRGGFIIRLHGQERPVPIGSMGDGMWRMMAMAIAIAQCKGGVLLVDEIDTGLHYTVMEKMWRLIFGAAKDLDVQVFASTHSYDCIKSLADLCYTETDARDNVTLQRIEVGNSKAVPFTDDEIEIAAEKNIEVR